MKAKSIDFRELLDRLLPIEQLPRIHHTGLDHAFRGFASEIAGPGGLALAPAPSPPDAPAAPPRIEIPTERPGIVIHPRASLPSGAQAGLEPVGRLLRLDDPMLSGDPRRADARMELVRLLNQAGRVLLGASTLRFLPREELDAGGSEALDPETAREARLHPELLYACPDIGKLPRPPAQALRRGVLSWVMAGVASSQGEPLGALEVASTERDAFGLDELAMIALLADYWAGVLERAARIEKLVFIDPLTSAYNRSYFDQQVLNEMARAEREGTSMALCIADIDNFKSFNTRYGFEAGNRVLVQVAQALRRGVRPFDTVARWGGEEFAVLLTAPVLAHDVLTISERLRSLVERTQVTLEALDRRTHNVPVTVSIGVALLPDHAQTAADLWRVANQALLEAKRPPKNQVVFYTPPPR